MSQATHSFTCKHVQALPTVTALVVALASTLVLTLAGCASTTGINAPQAKVVAPATLGVSDSSATAPVGLSLIHI